MHVSRPATNGVIAPSAVAQGEDEVLDSFFLLNFETVNPFLRRGGLKLQIAVIKMLVHQHDDDGKNRTPVHAASPAPLCRNYKNRNCIGRESNPGLAETVLWRMATANFTTKPPMQWKVFTLRWKNIQF